MEFQRFYLQDGGRYIEYSVEDMEYDYANVIVRQATGDQPVAGIGYILREEVVVGIALDTDVPMTTKRWFAYDAGACSGVPGSRVGNVNAGYATMENAIKALLGEYATVTDAVMVDGVPTDDDCDNKRDDYDYDPVSIDVWCETGRDGFLSPAVSSEIKRIGRIHAMTSSLMCDMIREVSKSMWLHHGLLLSDETDVRMSVSVDAPTDMFGDRIADSDKPFDGMTLVVELCPSLQSVACPGSVTISVIDVENAEDGNVLVGTSIVNGRDADYANADESLSVGISVDSLASEATDRTSVASFANRIMSTFFNSLMRRMVMEYQSRVDVLREASQGEWNETLTDGTKAMGDMGLSYAPDPYDGGNARSMEYA